MSSLEKNFRQSPAPRLYSWCTIPIVPSSRYASARHDWNRAPRTIGLIALLVAAGLMFGLVANAQPPARVAGANYKQANKYSDAFLKQFTYSTSVEPQWIGKSDAFWYEYRTSKGKQWYKVQPKDAKKEPLFDRVKLGAQLSEEVRKPLDPLQLPVTRGSFSEDGAKFKFVTENWQFEYDLRAEKLAKLGKATAAPTGVGAMSPEQQQRMREILGEERFKELLDQQKKGTTEKKKSDESFDGEILSEDERLLLADELSALNGNHHAERDAYDPQKKKGGGKGGLKGGPGASGDYRNFSPDKSMYAFVKNYNLYVAEAGKEDQAKQLTKDGQENYTFGAGGGFGGQQILLKDKTEKDLLSYGQEKETDVKPGKDKKTRAPVTWAKDSKAFYVLRRDTRGVKDLFLVNSVAEPRPTLTKYPYAMPGEENVRKSELYVFHCLPTPEAGAGDSSGTQGGVSVAGVGTPTPATRQRGKGDARQDRAHMER